MTQVICYVVIPFFAGFFVTFIIGYVQRGPKTRSRKRK